MTPFEKLIRAERVAQVFHDQLVIEAQRLGQPIPAPWKDTSTPEREVLVATFGAMLHKHVIEEGEFW